MPLTVADLQAIGAIAHQAGEKIMEIYRNQAAFQQVNWKADASPLTLADRESHRLIEEALQQSYPSIPLLSEEGKHTDYDVRRHWPRFWLVDPLDGTKEFIQRNGEFTVNIALLEDNRPVVGIIYAPVLDRLYFAAQGVGAFRQEGSYEAVSIRVNHKRRDLIAVGSRSHSDEAERALLNQFPIREQIGVGSSLKFCLIADGTADFYYRHGPTMEWDTAAGQAIVEIAGGTVKTLQGEALPYNKSSLVNDSFICEGRS